jgi:hypothetical protein
VLRKAFRQLVEEEGYAFDSEVLAHLSPYITEHVNRFGTYTLNLGRAMPPPDYSQRLQPELTKAE